VTDHISIGTFLRTVRHLTPRQTAALIRHRAFLRGAPSLAPPPPTRGRERPPAPGAPAKGGFASPTEASFVGIDRTFESAVDWAPDDVPGLWVYHLNYFDDLPCSSERATPSWLPGLVGQWIDANPPARGPAWDPYPTSRRLANWARWLLEDGPEDGLRELVLESLAVQARHLERNLEFHLLGNHLMANAKGLVSAGVLFSGDEGERWLERGLSLLQHELDYQVLGDGGHIERSPMYHAVVVCDVLDVLNLLTASRCEMLVAERLSAGVSRMLDWLATMSHPDDGPGFFNDTTLGAAPTVAELGYYAHRLGVRWNGPSHAPVCRLRSSGYVRLTPADGRTMALFDAAGPIGPDEQPGHGHCDALSFEISRDGARLFVNAGISTYERSPERLRERGTAAHNTVRIDGEEQSEIWASHRVGRRARPVRNGVEGGGAFGAHDGYAHLPGAPVHGRRFGLDERGVRIEDEFEGAGPHRLEWFFHLHPECGASLDARTVTVDRDGRPVARMIFPEALTPTVREDAWHPGFHRSVVGRTVAAAADAALPADFTISIEWLD